MSAIERIENICVREERGERKQGKVGDGKKINEWMNVGVWKVRERKENSWTESKDKDRGANGQRKVRVSPVLSDVHMLLPELPPPPTPPTRSTHSLTLWWNKHTHRRGWVSCCYCSSPGEKLILRCPCVCMCVDVCLSVEVKAQRTAEAQHSLVAERKGARGLNSGEVKFFFSLPQNILWWWRFWNWTFRLSETLSQLCHYLLHALSDIPKSLK